MWENPYYFFRISYIDRFGEKKERELFFNVIQSAMYRDLKKDLIDVLEILLGNDSDYDINSVLDFGCGKLRTVDYILEKGKENTVVDYREIIEKYDYLNEKLERLKDNKFFKEMNFPLPFTEDKTKYDLCLLINVLPIIPVFLERLLILQILYGKIKNEKYLLWYAMHNPTIYRKREKTCAYFFGDGIWIGKGNFKSFYKYNPPEFVTLMMYLSGFRLERIFKVPAVNALLFQRTKYNLFEGIITKDLIEDLIKSEVKIENGELKSVVNEKIEINPYPEEFNVYNLIKNYLGKIIPGREEGNPNKFKRLIAGIFQYIFFEQLTGMVIEDPIDEGKGLIDITFRLSGRNGFFTKLQENYKVMCPIIFIECKNKSDKLASTEYQQIYSRLDNHRGKFGILVCRDKFDENEVLSNLKPKIKKGEYVIVLDDKDILKLLKIRIEDGEDAVNDFFEKKIKELVM